MHTVCNTAPFETLGRTPTKHCASIAVSCNSMLSDRQPVSLVFATELSSGVRDFTPNVLKISKLLQRAASTLNSATQQISLPWHANPQPTLLVQASPAHNVRLLALAPPCWHPPDPYPGHQPQQLAVDRGEVYAATLLQHAAFLLLLLVSDSLLLLIPGPAVPAHILQLLHVLPKVRQQLLQLIQARQKQVRTTKATKGQLQPQDPEQQQQMQPSGGSPAAVSLPTEGKPEQQYEQLLQLLQKPATQLHIALQVSTIAEASICVQQAEHTLLKCKAAVTVTAQQTAAPAGSNKIPVGNITVRSSSLLFELAGVHACSDDTRSQTALRRAVLRTIQQQLLNTSVLQQQLLEKEQQQQLPTADRVLASLAATAAATTAADSLPAGSMENLQQLWQQLLQLLSPAAASNGGGSSSKCYPFYQRITLQADDGVCDDVSADSADDADWDEVGDSWQEVTQHAESAGEDDADSAGEDDADSATAPGELLMSAVDPLYHMSSKRCAAAARAALRAYLQAVPLRYTATAHESALRSALLHYQTAAAGPASDDVQHQLQQACVAVWQSGRQQCSAVSLTGRPCTLAPHDVAKVPHSSGASFILAAPDGSEQQQQQQQQHDWFNFDDANVQPAQQLLQQQQRPQQHQAGIHTGMISAVVKLLLPAGTDQDRVSTSSQPHQIQLGSWFSLWQRRPEPAAAGSAAVTLPGQRWLPGFNKLLQLRVLGPSHAAATAAAAEASDAEGTSEDGQPDPATASAGPADSMHILEGILEGINIKGSRGSARRRGRGARGAAAAAAGSDSWSDALATSGQRGGKAKPQQPLAAPAAVTLGPEDFPTLSEAATGNKKNLLADNNLQQQAAEAGSTVALVRGRQRHRRRDDGSAERLQQQLIQAWGHLDEQQYAAGSTAAPSTYMNAVSSNKPSAPAGVSGQADGGSAKRGRGRGHRAAAAAAVEKPLPAAVTSANDQAVLATLWIGLEYESLCGVRAVLHPGQLLNTVQQQEQQRQQEQTTASAAAVAAAAAARNLPGSRGQGRGRARSGRAQRQQLRDGSSTAPHNRQLLADSSSGSGSSSDALGVEQLVSQDIPLFIHPAAAGFADAGSPSASAATAVTSTVAAGTVVTPLDMQLLQLKRIYVRTPHAPFMFASHPRIVYTAAAGAAAAGSGVTSTASHAAGESSDQGSMSQSIIEFSTCGPVQLPTDNLSVLSLPQLYGAPAGWVQAVAPAAVAAVAAAAVDVDSVSAAAGTSSADTADCSSSSSTAASGAAAADPQPPADVGDIFSTGFTTGAAARPISCSEVEGSNHWLPLIPVKAPSTDVDSSRPSTSSQTAAVVSSGKGVSKPLVPGPWSAYLCGGSWLYPMSLQQR